jgi:hypothetical protein
MIYDRARRHVKRYAGPHRALVNAHCLYRFDEPVSPHLAADMAAGKEGSQVSLCDAHSASAELGPRPERRRTHRRCLCNLHNELHS